MKKIDSVVRRETLYITAWVLILSAVTEAIFLAVGKWELSVLIGNLIGAAAAVLNFFLMGLSVQAALGKDEKDAKSTVKLSQTLRNMMLVVILAAGVILDQTGVIGVNIIAMLVPLLFPSIAVKLRMIQCKDPKKGGEASK